MLHILTHSKRSFCAHLFADRLESLASPEGVIKTCREFSCRDNNVGNSSPHHRLALVQGYNEDTGAYKVCAFEDLQSASSLWNRAWTHEIAFRLDALITMRSYSLLLSSGESDTTSPDNTAMLHSVFVQGVPGGRASYKDHRSGRGVVGVSIQEAKGLTDKSS